MEYIVTHDFGTSATKSALYDRDGNLIATHTTEYPSYRPHPGWVEQDPHDWWRAFCEGNKAITAGIDPKDIAALAFDGTTSNCVMVDADGEPLCRAPIWQDARATEEEKIINEKLTPEQKAGRGGIAAGRCAMMLYWFKRNHPELFEKMAYWCTSNCFYILFKLTGKAIASPDLAWSTMLYNAERTDWSYDVVDVFGFDHSILPTVYPPNAIVGEIPASIAEECGLPAGVKILNCVSDGAQYGTGTNGMTGKMATINCGTSGSAGIVGVRADGVRGSNGTGASFELLRRTICREEEQIAKETGRSVFDVMVEEAMKAPAGSNGVVFIPYPGGERGSRDNPKAKASFSGISLSTTRADIIRSVIEGIGFNLNELIDHGRAMGYDPRQAVIMGGLAKNPNVVQIFANITGMEMLTLKNSQWVVSASNAARACLALGWFDDEVAVDRHFCKYDQHFLPDMAEHELYKKYAAVFEDVYKSQVPIYEELWDL